MPSLHNYSKRGFTLTELTVVVLIVFVLGMVLFPVFTKRRGSHGPSCASNQKQIALGFLQYTQDYDEHYPPAVGYVEMQPTSEKERAVPEVLLQSWGPDRRMADGRYVPGILSPYVKSNQLFIAPEETHSQQARFILHYMYNDLVAGVSMTKFTALARTVLTTDAEDRLKNVGHALTMDSGPYEAQFNQEGGCDAGSGASVGKARLRDRGGANFSFTDGHVKWFKGGADDKVFFPPRESDSISAVDAKTKQQIGPKPGADMMFQGRQYDATFHIR